ncbi:hypothetical protein FACS1894142_5250 [Spirochaetia bacterium]|nr:hypothetical protein FACS1894142_5250 [Spirochaetia bacterium]
MNHSFSEIKLFQVKPDKLDEFESMVESIAKEQKKQKGVICIKYMKRFFHYRWS